MALLNFKYGAQSNLSNQAFSAGTIYITSDTKKLFIDNPDSSSDRICLGDFQLVSWTKSDSVTSPDAALSDYPLKNTNILYITIESASGATAMWRYDGSSFITISNSEEMADIVADMEALQTRATNLEQQILHFGECSTAANTTTKIVSCPNFKLYEGALIAVRMAYTNTIPNASLNVNNTGAKQIYAQGTGLSNSWIAQSIVLFVYTGEYWVIVDNGALVNVTEAHSVAAAALPKSGGTMTGAITLHADPTDAMHAVTKQYMDNAVGEINTDIDSLKNNIGNLSNIMNFLGVTTTSLIDGDNTNPIVINDEDITAIAGDVVVVSNSIVGDSTVGDFVLSEGKEFVFDGNIWHEIGDTVAQSTAISNLQEQVDNIDNDVSGLSNRVNAIETDVANLQAWKESHATAYTNLTARVTNAETDITNLIAVLTWGTF